MRGKKGTGPFGRKAAAKARTARPVSKQAAAAAEPIDWGAPLVERHGLPGPGEAVIAHGVQSFLRDNGWGLTFDGHDRSIYERGVTLMASDAVGRKYFVEIRDAEDEIV